MIINIKCNEKLDKGMVGNKGYYLNCMFRLGHTICDGYILTPDFFDTFLSFNSILSSDTKFLDEIKRGKFPEAQRDLLDKVFQKLAKRTGAVIVRSSTLDEDTANRSFAGIYESVGDISDFSDMLTAIKKVWASYYSNQTEAYHESRTVSMPIVIQEMVQCDKAGVLFTRNPLNYEQEYVVEACLGNNDKIINNECEAERYVISKDRSSNGKKRVLSKQELKELGHLAGEIERELGFPCDIEWGMSGGIYYLFQARPIVFSTEADIYYHTQENLDCILLDRYAKPASVCYLSLLDAWQNKVYLSFYHKKRGKELEEFPLCFLYNRVYWNNRYQQKYFQDDGNSSPYKKIRFYFLVKTGYKKWYGRLAKYDKNISSYQKRLENMVDHVELVNLLTDVIQNFCIHIGIDHYRFLGVAQILYRKLEKSMKEDHIEEDILKMIGTKTNQSKTVQVNKEILTLADYIRSTKEWFLLFTENDENTILRELEHGEMYRVFWEKLQKFLKEHGHRGIDCDDLYYPHWIEHPQSVITLLKQFLINHLKEDENPEADAIGHINIRKKRLIDLCGVYMCLREDQRYYFDKSWVLIRDILLRLADLFLEKKVLEEKQDIFHLTIREIIDGVIYSECLPDKELILKRKDYFEKASQKIPPYMLKDSVSVPVQKGKGYDSYKVMGVSSGYAVGRIKFINDMKDLADVKKGEIGVVKTFHPSWTPVLKVVSGLIMNYGNVLSHGSVVAREYKIPVVVFNGEVQNVLKNGDFVRIDGKKGRMHILQKADGGMKEDASSYGNNNR